MQFKGKVKKPPKGKMNGMLSAKMVYNKMRDKAAAKKPLNTRTETDHEYRD